MRKLLRRISPALAAAIVSTLIYAAHQGVLPLPRWDSANSSGEFSSLESDKLYSVTITVETTTSSPDPNSLRLSLWLEGELAVAKAVTVLDVHFIFKILGADKHRVPMIVALQAGHIYSLSAEMSPKQVIFLARLIQEGTSGGKS